MKRIANPETNKFRYFKLSEEEYHELDDGSQGLCVACGEVRDGCEPDARGYECESCETRAVYGAAELLMMGRIRLVG